MCVGLPLAALLAGKATGCEEADREHDCSEQTLACSCQSDGASNQHDIVSSDYRFIYLGCKVGKTLSIRCTESLKLETLPYAPYMMLICVLCIHHLPAATALSET